LPDQGGQGLYDQQQLIELLLAGYQVLTPNSRMARGIIASWNQAQLERGLSTWPTALVSPLETWLQSQWREGVRMGLLKPVQCISQGQQLELWQQLIARHERESKGYNLLRPIAAAEQACRARDTLIRWQVDTTAPRVQALFELDDDCATFYIWEQLFTEKMASLGMITASDALASLLDRSAELPQSKLVLVGFDDMPPLLSSCVQALAADLQEVHANGRIGKCSACTFPEKRTELATVARWAKTLAQGGSPPSIGIILPNMAQDRPTLEYMLRREFSCLGENYTSLPVNFSTGIALERVPMISDALLMLSMERQRIAVDDVVKVLQSRFHSMGDINSGLAVKFIRRLFDAGSAFIDAGDLRYQASRIKPAQPDQDSAQGLEIGQVLLDISGMRDLRRPAMPSEWADRFSTVLEVWGWPGSVALDSIEYQQLKLWHTLLDDYSGYDSVCEAMSQDEALQLLRRCCARQVSQPKTPDSAIQVLGLLEAAGLSFDYLWICDMQAANWPAPARPNPFIPMRLQRDLVMPNASAEREWTYAQSLMSQYMRSAGTVLASYAQQRDGVPQKPSALLEEFEWQVVEAAEIIDEQWLAVQQSTRIEQCVDELAPPVEAGELKLIAGGSGLLEDQSHCPFKAFARRRLKIKPLGEAGIALSAAERGSLLHEALFHLWGTIGDSAALAAMDNDKAASVVDHAVSAAIEDLPVYRRGGMGPDYFELESQRLKRLLGEWLLVERQRPEFTVVGREKAISLKLEGLDITLRADRIDELADGAQFIIDYKSGVSNPQDWLGERPARPQLPLYGLAMSETVAGLAFAQVRTRDCKYTGAGQTEVAPGVQSDIEKLVKEKMPVKDWEDLTAAWQGNLQRLAREFISGQAQVDPLKDSSCTYCGLQALCRVGEL